MPNIKVAIVTFLNTNASQRYVYQTINWKQGGVDVSAGLKIGGLVASIRTGPVAGSGLMICGPPADVWWCTANSEHDIYRCLATIDKF